MSKINEKTDIYQEVTDKIIELLETHKKLDYTSTWLPTHGEFIAYNPVSCHAYNGINILLLFISASIKGYKQNRWMTYKQALELGAYVRKGEESTMIIFYSKLYIDRKTAKNVTTQVKEILANGGAVPDGVDVVPFLSKHNVFNLEQLEQCPENLFFKGETLTFTEPDKDDLAEEFINRTGARIEYVENGGNCYFPVFDYIQLCKRNQFTGKEAFYATAFHELGHWTGHESRLNRQIKNKAKTPEYAFEELVAELFSAFTCARLGFASQITNNAAYIESWLTCLKNDKKFILQASGKAQKAADFACEMVGYSLPKEQAQ
jgi:antirestriction protein ArdC